MKKRKIILIIFMFIIGVIAGIAGTLYYRETRPWSETRNGEQSNKAKCIALAYGKIADDDGRYAGKNFVITNDDTCGISDTEGDELRGRLAELCKVSDVDLKKCVYYLEVRGGEVYKTYYARWKYTTYVGGFPQYGNTVERFDRLTEQALDEYKKIDN